ncbi:MAG: AAA family ATPase [Clostridia bacterium]|nr:AAA family ATPase [Clostridia bacterium]
MKLLSYHIENYGKIHGADGKFDGGLTEFFEKNGFGKTTMASFIRAMFYGLPSYTTKTKTFDDRQHFYPFEGGKFGGNITFEMQGKTYKIERFFGKKSNRDDELKIYCNGAPYLGFGEDIGKEVFGLDEESFKKTVFITADEIEIESTHSINEKLNRDVHGTDEGDFEAAIDELEKVKKQLKASRGNNDLISEKKTEIFDLNARIKNLNDMSDGLEGEYVEREQLTRGIADAEKTLKEASERGLILQKWKTLDNLAAQIEQKTAILQENREKYPNGLPNEAERKILNDCVQEETRLNGSLQTAIFGEDKEKELFALQKKFANGVPTEQEIAEKQQALTKLWSLNAERERLLKREKTQREKTLEGKFSAKVPTENELAQKRERIEEYKRKSAELSELQAALLIGDARKPSNVKGKTVVPVLLSAVLITVGIVLAALQYIVPGIALAAVGIALLAVGLTLGKKSVDVSQTQTSVSDIAALQAELRVAEENLRAFTVPYGYYSDAGIVYDFATLEEDVKGYKSQVVAEREYEGKIVALTQEIEQIETQARDFLAKFGAVGVGLQNGLNRLLAEVSSYASLQADQAAASGKTDSVRARIFECRKKIDGILQKYRLEAFVGTMDGLKGLEIACNTLVALEETIADLQENLTNYKTKNGLTERPTGEVVETDTVHETLSVLRKRLADCDKRIAETERLVEKLPDVQSELECAEETLEEYKDRYALLSETIDALKGAEKTLQDRYVAPIKEKFSRYAEALERVLDEKVTMDSDYRVKFERGGEERSDRHLSAGERSICALCLRLALIDNMYETEQPFIVMDDPFVHLDETHMKRTAELVKALAKEKQIIYFCCHESRSLVK